MANQAAVLGTVRCGTAGWAYPHWNGVVYPQARGSGFHPLEFLSRYVDSVEINSSFYNHLKPEVTRLWMKKTEGNPKFRFTAKLHQRFTHARVLEPAEIAQFKEGLFPILRAGKLGAVLMQFPWAFRFTAENREFFVRLRREFKEFPLVAEMRHESWMSEDALGTFIDQRVGFCNIDQPAYARAMPPTSYLTSAVGYIRLHGRNPGNSLGAFREGASRPNQHDYLYSANELSEWIARIEKVARYAMATFVVTNNDMGGKSLVNALMLQRMLGDERRAAPGSLVRLYPEELEAFGKQESRQESLFSAA